MGASSSIRRSSEGKVPRGESPTEGEVEKVQVKVGEGSLARKASVSLAFTGSTNVSDNPVIANAIKHLAPSIQAVQFMAGDTVVTAGQDQGVLYIVQVGTLGMYSNSGGGIGEDGFVGKLPAGKMGGLDSLVDNTPQTYTAKAEEDCQILKIQHEQFMECVRGNDDLLHMLMERMRGGSIPAAPFSPASSPRAGANNKIMVRPKLFSHDVIRVAFFDAKPYDRESFNKYNREGGSLIDFRYIDEQLSEDTVSMADGCHVVCLFVNDGCNAPILEKLKKLGVEMITMRCAGFDRVDLEACERLGLTVARVPAYSPYAVAEHAAALLQMINRKLNVAYDRVKQGNFSLSGLVGFDLHGKKCGVLGTGKIGQCFINIALGFGMEVLMYDVFKNPKLEENPKCRYVQLDEVFSQCDVVSIHLPLLPSTKHVVCERTLGLMQPHAILLNVSRGGLVDTQALIDSLRSMRIGGAGLDVYENEASYFFADKSAQNIADDQLSRLLSFRNCILTSHQAFLTEEALEAISKTTISNVIAFNKGQTMKECPNSVNK